MFQTAESLAEPAFSVQSPLFSAPPVVNSVSKGLHHRETESHRAHRDPEIRTRFVLATNLYNVRVPTIRIIQEQPDSPSAKQLLEELDEELQRHPYPAESRHAFSIEQLLQQRVAFFVVVVDEEPAGCGGVKIFDSEYGEVKRMYVRPAHRRLGLGVAILDRLSQYAQSHGVDMLRLETGIYQVEAIGFYERYGFARRSPFGEYRIDPLSVYFEMRLNNRSSGSAAKVAKLEMKDTNCFGD